MLVKRQKQAPRGIRNNNPLNIKHGNVWLGEVAEPTDPTFEQFCSMEYGLRAAFIILRRYIRRYHADTISSIISKWAPEQENALLAYINAVVAFTGIQPDVHLKYEDREVMVQLVQAMIRVECGQLIDEDVIIKGYNMA